MKKHITINNKVFKIVSILLAATIGAGFASGREAMTFFREYSVFNYILLFVVFIGLAFMMYVFARLGGFLKASEATEINKVVFKKFSPIMNILIPLGLFGTLFAMIAGLDSVAISVIPNYSYSLPWLSLLISTVVIVIVSGGLKVVLNATSIIMPVVLIILFLTTISFLIFGSHGVVDYNTDLTLTHFGVGLFSTLLYIGNNLTTGGVILTQLGGVLDKRQSKVSSISFSALFTIAAALVILTLFLSSNSIFGSDMPMVEVANLINPVLGIIYGVILFFAISMTLTACAFALTSWFKKYFKNSSFCTVTSFMILGFILSRLGFGTILDIVYPIKGAIGFIFGLGVLVYYLKNRRKIKELQ
ncbi:MAG: hypothetical protein AB7S44_00825 [Spirochaetales bacterium]